LQEGKQQGAFHQDLPKVGPMPLLEIPQGNALGQAVWEGTFSSGLLCLCKEVTKIFLVLIKFIFA
jgi:hypothetical protein